MIIETFFLCNSGHIPFRDSKLTRILQNSLSGNARVSVICTISPSVINIEESQNTLKFAARVKKVVTKAHTNAVCIYLLFLYSLLSSLIN